MLKKEKQRGGKIVNKKVLQIGYLIRNICKAKDIYLGALKLQKLLWYCAISYYVKNKKHLFSESFYAWDYGVVLKTAWWYRYEILDAKDQAIEPDDLDSEIKEIVTNVVNKKGTMDGKTLSDENHNQEPWKITRQKGFNEAVTEHLIEKYAGDINEKYLQ